jgi:hypothetical protein
MTGINREPGLKETARQRLLTYLLDKLTKLKINDRMKWSKGLRLNYDLPGVNRLLEPLTMEITAWFIFTKKGKSLIIIRQLCNKFSMHNQS